MLLKATLLLLISSSALAAVSPEVTQISANDYVDKVLAALRLHIRRNELDPLAIPDLVAEFSKKVAIITVHGSARLTDGRLHGLATIHRTGRSTVIIRGRRLQIATDVGVTNLWGAMDARAEFMGIGVNAKISIGIERVSVSTKINAVIGGGKVVPELDDFSISDISRIVVRFRGLGPLDWIINPVTNFVVNAIRGLLTRVLQGPIAELLREALKEVELPLPRAE